MEFNESLDVKTYFQTLTEAKDFRVTLWENIDNRISRLKQKLFDDFSIEESIYIINDFFDTSIYSLKKADVILELNKNEMEEVLEGKIIQMFEHDAINYFIHNVDENRFFKFKDGYFKEMDLKVEIKEKL
jgi:hypothetical protein